MQQHLQEVEEDINENKHLNDEKKKKGPIIVILSTWEVGQFSPSALNTCG